MSLLHSPVMLKEAIEALQIRPDGIYIDATFGRGGHSQAILQHLSSMGRLICLDRDPHAIAFGQAHWGQDPRVTLMQSCFSKIGEIAKTLEVLGRVNGILVDCGVSSPQLDDPARGFSFLRDGPLDMRMDPSKGMSAQEWLAVSSFEEMVFVFKKYGEEPFAKKIARQIEEKRRIEPLLTTKQLADLVKLCVPMKKTHRHPATQIFQAIRIHLNEELQALEVMLHQAISVLAQGGRLSLLSFHSLEDRIIKRFFRSQSKIHLPKGVALIESQLQAPLKCIIKRQRPDETEVTMNPRSRSAILRVAEKISGD